MANQQRDKSVTIIPVVISSNAQSTDFSTNSYDVTQFSKYSLQLIITSASSLNVAVKVQESLDNTNWADVPGSSVSFTTNGTYIWTNGNSSSNWTRLTFTFTGGSALFQVLAFSKL